MKNQVFIFLVTILMLAGCDSKPKMIVEDAQSSPAAEGMVPVEGGGTATAPGGIDVHQVLAKEILQAERYTYLKVQEGQRLFWIATSKMEAQTEKMYLYRGGLLKTNFESQEFKRVFDTIYLVSHIIDATQHPGGNMQGGGALSSGNMSESTASPVNMPVSADAISIKDLFANKKKYEGKQITVAGECVKVNNGIMGRNWVHLQDGSIAEGKKLDLTVTTDQLIQPGSKVALQGKVTLNKDFGAGYRYDIIVEGVEPKQK